MVEHVVGLDWISAKTSIDAWSYSPVIRQHVTNGR